MGNKRDIALGYDANNEVVYRGDTLLYTLLTIELGGGVVDDVIIEIIASKRMSTEEGHPNYMLVCIDSEMPNRKYYVFPEDVVKIPSQRDVLCEDEFYQELLNVIDF